MNTFVSAVQNQEARTENGMKARKSTASACVDLFFKIGASRGKNITKEFTAAYVEDKDLALRIVQYARDVREGAGERQIFRDVLVHLEKVDSTSASALLHKVPNLGRWDDIFSFKTDALKNEAYDMLGVALREQNGLAAKWTPRQGPIALEIRKRFGMSPKFYRKSLVELTKVVESQMCANDWDNINFSHVPSLATSRYKKAFNRHTETYVEYVKSLVKGDADVKVNASAVYPYDVIKGVINQYRTVSYDETELNLIIKQWEALPNYVGNNNVLALVDVSGSMSCSAGGSKSITCLDVAVSLGLYVADKNKGKFKDTFLTFSSKPELMLLKGNVVQKCNQMSKSDWEMSTNLHAAMNIILKTAVDGNVPQEEMPTMLLIMSDMQFNACTTHDFSVMQMIDAKYLAAGYNVPSIVFWNLNAKDNVPVAFDKTGVALVSGFSPSILKAVLAADIEDFTPEAIMRKAVCIPRYDI